jgi:hypothetical protein
VSERAGVKAGGIPPSALLLRASWRWKTSWSCERRHSSRGDVGSRASVGPFASRASPREVGRADDSGCPEVAEEGNVVRMRPKRMHRRTHERSSLAHGSTRPSLGPSTRAASSSRERGRTIRHHGWANPRKWEEPALGPDGRTQRGSPRVDAPARERARRVRKGRRSRPPSLRGSRARRLVCPHVVFQLQKSAGDVWPRISSAHALPKERSGSSERGSSAERRSAGQTVGGRAGRKRHRASESPAQVGRRSAQDPGWRESAIQRLFHRSRAVQRSWDRGCNGHRIPGRVSCRTKALRIIIEASRSREATTDGLGVPAHSPTRVRGQKPTSRRQAAHAKAWEARG